VNIFQAIILGIVEGLTEFFPISSTGHLILTSKLLKIADSDFVTTFEIAIQLGAILAVVVVSWRRFLQWNILKRIIVAFFPTAIIGFVLYKLVKEHLLQNPWIVVWSLLIGGVLLIVFERWYSTKTHGPQTLEQMSYRQAAFIGVVQALAVIPGVSRSAATIVAGLAAGLGRTAIVEFSFLLAVPTILGATALDVVKTSPDVLAGHWTALIIGTVTAFLVAWLAIRFFLRFVRTNTFVVFGVYRILVAIVFLVMFTTVLRL
jgi:undecaprenyl-diphosphatase